MRHVGVVLLSLQPQYLPARASIVSNGIVWLELVHNNSRPYYAMTSLGRCITTQASDIRWLPSPNYSRARVTAPISPLGLKPIGSGPHRLVTKLDYSHTDSLLLPPVRFCASAHNSTPHRKHTGACWPCCGIHVLCTQTHARSARLSSRMPCISACRSCLTSVSS